jgi:hypothetical protein
MQKECPRPIGDAFGLALIALTMIRVLATLTQVFFHRQVRNHFRRLLSVSATWLDHWLTRFWLWFERIPVEAPSLAIETSLRPARGCLAYSSSSDIPGSPGLFLQPPFRAQILQRSLNLSIHTKSPD